MSDVTKLPITTFVTDGYLQEVNRLLLHPLGLAIEATSAEEPVTWLSLDDRSVKALNDLVSFAMQGGRYLSTTDLERLSKRIKEADRHDTGDMWLSGVWDYRADPEGIIFGGDYKAKLAVKAAKVGDEWAAREAARVAILGEMVQSVGDGSDG